MRMINAKNVLGVVLTRVLRVVKKMMKRRAHIVRRVWRVGDD